MESLLQNHEPIDVALLMRAIQRDHRVKEEDDTCKACEHNLTRSSSVTPTWVKMTTAKGWTYLCWTCYFHTHGMLAGSSPEGSAKLELVGADGHSICDIPWPAHAYEEEEEEEGRPVKREKTSKE